jgi:hypothetical protein
MPIVDPEHALHLGRVTQVLTHWQGGKGSIFAVKEATGILERGLRDVTKAVLVVHGIGDGGRASIRANAQLYLEPVSLYKPIGPPT